MTDPVVNAFIGRREIPTDADLCEPLGAAKPAWDALISALAGLEVTGQEWMSYSPKHGWALRLLRRKRTIVWLAPCAGCFQVLFILGDKAVRAAREAGLAARVIQALDQAPKYPEGTGLRLVVKGLRDLPALKKLAAVKLAN